MTRILLCIMDGSPSFCFGRYQTATRNLYILIINHC